MKSPIQLAGLSSLLVNLGANGLMVAPWLFIAPQDEVELRFAPRPGAILAKQFELEVELRDFSIEIDNQHFLSDDSSPIRLLTTSNFIDTFAKSEAGRPLELLRAFGDISGKWEAEGARTDIVGFYSLSGCAVRFEWEPAHRDYSRRLEVGKVQGLHVDELVEDLDLRGFLPAEPVKVGAKWTAQGPPIMDALFGCTEMGLLGMPKEQELEVLIRDVLLRPFRELGDRRLEIDCRRAGGNGTANEGLVKIELRLLEKYELDISEVLNQFFVDMNSAYSNALKISSARISWDVDGRGGLDWNVTANHFAALDFAAKVRLECRLEMPRFMAPGNSPDMLVRVRSNGLIHWTARAEEPR